MIVKYTDEHYGTGFTDKDTCEGLPALRSEGCGCCAEYFQVTPEFIAHAIKEAEEWISFLQNLKPVDYSNVE